MPNIQLEDEDFILAEAEAKALAEWLRKNDKGDLAAQLSKPAGKVYRTVHERIVQAMRAVSYVSKDGFNQQQNYPFRGIDGVINALGPALREAGVFPTSEVLEIKYRDALTTLNKATREVTVRVAYTFHGADGDSITTVSVGESLDQSDKGTAKAMSVAMRVALLQMFALPTQEPTTDHDGQFHQRGGQPQMSDFERRTGLGLLAIPTAEQRESLSTLMPAAFRQALDFLDCIGEHTAWEQPTNGDDSPTWAELFAARVADEIAAVSTPAEGRALYGLLKSEEIDMSHQGKPFSLLLRERAAAIQAEQEARANNLTGLVLAARDGSGVGVALAMSDEDVAAGLITVQQHADISKVGEDRAAKLADLPTSEPAR